MASSGTITTNYYDSGDNDLGRYRLEWRVSKTSGLVSTISYTVYIDLTGSKLRPYSCFISLAGYNGGTVSTSSITVLPEGSYPGDDWSIYPSSGSSVGSGSFTVTHSSSAKGGFTLRLYGGIWVHNNTATDSGLVSNSLPDLYSNCTAPTSVSFSGNPEYLVPDSTNYIEVTWSGATAGTNNPISEYRVYYRYSSNGASPVIGSDSYKGVSNTTSARIPLSNTNRGQYLVVGVQSIGKYNSTSLKIASAKKVNVRPNAPTTNGSVTIRSTATEGTITGITAGQANFGSPGKMVYYNTIDTIPDGQGIAVESSFTGPPGDYYFWTWDGLEWSSSYTKVSIVKNIVPIINVTINNPSNSIVRYENSEISNVLETINFTVTAQNKSCYYTLKILRGTGTDERTLYTLTSNSYLSSAGSSENLSFNIRSLGLSEGSFYFQFACNDYLESGESIIKNNDGKNYYSPSLPTFSNNTTYNQFSEENVTETNSTDFYQNLRFVSSHYDSYIYNNGIFRLDTGSNETVSYTLTKTINSEISPEKIFYDVTITSDLVPGQSYAFFPTLQMAGLISSALVSRRRTPVLDPTPSSGSILYIKPFTDGWDKKNNQNSSSSKEIIISKGIYTGTEEESFYNEYNIDPSNKQWWKSEIIIPNGNSIDITDLINNGGSFEGDYYKRTFIINGDNFFKLLSSISTKQGVLSCALKNTITNRFNQTISKQSSIVTLDFNENPEIISISKTENNTDYLYEGGTLQLKYEYRTYSENKISYSYLINRNDGNGVVSYGDIISNEDSTSPSFGIGRLISEIVDIEIGEITNSTSCLFNIRFYDGSSTSYDTKFDISCKRIRFVNPIISFGKATYNKEDPKSYNVSCQYTISDYGYDPSQKADHIFSVSEEYLALNLSTEKVAPSTGDAVFSLDNEITDFKIGRLTLKATITYNGKSITKESTSNELIIYGITPTVAYRQNYLGINTNSIKDKEILRIAPATGRNIITFLKADGSNNIMTLNLDTGALTGFNIDWNSLTDLPEAIDCGEIT